MGGLVAAAALVVLTTVFTCVSLQCLVFSDRGLLSVLVMVTISNMFIHRIPKRPRLAVS